MPEEMAPEATEEPEAPEEVVETGLDPNALQSMLRQTRAEAAKHRRELRDAQAKLKDFESAQLSEQEKLQKRLAELEGERATWESERRSLVVNHAVLDAAARLGAIHPDAVVRLIDADLLKFDDNGRPTNVDDVVNKTAKAYPSLFRATGQFGSGDGGPRGRTSEKPDMNAWLRGERAAI